MEKTICNEIWKPVRGYEGLYCVSNYGRVKSIQFRNNRVTKEREIIMKPTDNGNGYLIVSLKINGKRKNEYVHRLVADAFIHKGTGKVVVHHKDFNKYNNAASNLEWCTQFDNVRHSIPNMKKPHTCPRGKTNEKYIYKNKSWFAVRVSKKYIGTFASIDQAVRARDYYLQHIGTEEKFRQEFFYKS